MSTDAESRKLSDLRVVDLRSELEKRGLDKNGNKQILLDRLQKALKDEGLDPEVYEFGKISVKSTSSNQLDPKDSGNDDEEGDEQTGDTSKGLEPRKNIENKTNGIKNVETTSNDKSKDVSKIEEKDESKTDFNVEDNLIQLTLEEGESFQDEEIDNGSDVNKSDSTNDKLEGEDTKNTSSKDQDAAKELADNSQKTQDIKQKGNASTLEASNTKSSAKPKRSYSSSRNLWITNIAQSTRATELKQALSSYGKVSGAKVVINAKHPGACCYGYVTMDSVQDANRCIENLNNTELNGHIIRIEKVRPDYMNLIKVHQKRNEVGKDKEKLSTTSNKEVRSTSRSRDQKKEPAKDKGEKSELRKDSNSKYDSFDTRRESRSRGKSGERLYPMQANKIVRSKNERDILTFDKIKEEREKQRLREKERVLREESRRRREEAARQRDVEKMQRSEAARLDRERQKLRMEREKLERDKAEIISLERERQKVERERLELEKLELQRVKMRLQEEDRRSVKRSSSYRREEPYEDRKRLTTERRYEESSQIRFDQPGGVKTPNPSAKKFGSSNKEFKSRVVYDKRDSYPKRDRDFEGDRSHPQSTITRGPPTTITKYEGSSVFNIGRERDGHDTRPRDTPAVSNSRMTKDSRYNEREREHHYRSIRDDRDRRSLPEHKGDVRSPRDHHRYSEQSKEPQRFDRNSGGNSSWGHPGTSKFNQSGGSSMSWTKDAWRPVEPVNNSDRWNSSSMTRGVSMTTNNFQGNSNVSVGPSCPPPPAINNYGGDRFEYKSISNIRKY